MKRFELRKETALCNNIFNFKFIIMKNVISTRTDRQVSGEEDRQVSGTTLCKRDMESVGLKEEDVLGRMIFITIPATPDVGESPRRGRKLAVIIKIMYQLV